MVVGERVRGRVVEVGRRWWSRITGSFVRFCRDNFLIVLIDLNVYFNLTFI